MATTYILGVREEGVPSWFMNCRQVWVPKNLYDDLCASFLAVNSNLSEFYYTHLGGGLKTGSTGWYKQF